MRMDIAELVGLAMEQDKQIEALNWVAVRSIQRKEALSLRLGVLAKVQENKKDYNVAWPWVTKLVYALMENERPMQAREIGAYLSKKEPRLMDRTDAVRILLHTCAMAVPWGGS